jgi:hypothetical protein
VLRSELQALRTHHIEKELAMNLHDTIKALQNAFHDLVNHAENEIVEYAAPAIAVISKNGGKILLGLAEQVLAAAVAGTPWAENISTRELPTVVNTA